MIVLQIESEQLSSLMENAVRKVLQQTPKTEHQTEAVVWFNLNELCEYHPNKPSKPTVYGWVHDGLIPCHKGSKSLRFLKSEIDNWLKQGKKKTLEETANEAELYINTKRKK